MPRGLPRPDSPPSPPRGPRRIIESMSPSPFAVSVIDYVNTWPLTWGFLKGAVEGVRPITDVPSACVTSAESVVIDALLFGLRVAKVGGYLGHQERLAEARPTIQPTDRSNAGLARITALEPLLDRRDLASSADQIVLQNCSIAQEVSPVRR